MKKGENPDSLSVPLPPQMILRILVPDEYSTVPLGEKFGAPPDRVQVLTEEAFKLDLEVIGVSFHCGSGCHNAKAYGDAIRIAKEAIDVINDVIHKWNSMDGKDRLECTLLDIGGGYPGIDAVGADSHRFTSTGGSDLNASDSNIENYGDEATAHQISSVVTPLLDDLFPVAKTPLRIISEPGRYFVEAAFVYCARIYSVKAGDTDGKRHYYIAQGVHGLFKDVLLCNEVFIPTPLMIRYDEEGRASIDKERSDDHQLLNSVVHGPSGEDFDIICNDCQLPNLTIGDFLIFDRMGAYTLSIAARNSSLPVRYVFGGGEL
jgi:ornithine decarboxylase